MMAKTERSHKAVGFDAKDGRQDRKGGSGSGSDTAKEIPWTKILERHISQIEGHLKMVDMIKKHTVEGTRDWSTICDLSYRTQEMLLMAKSQFRTLLPSVDHLDQAPVSFSSASGYPEYSTEDLGDDQPQIIAKDQNIDLTTTKSNGELSQSVDVKRTKLADLRAATAAHEISPGSENDSGSNGPEKNSSESRVANGFGKGARAENDTVESAAGDATSEKENPFFVIDVNPTPVHLPGITMKSPKRGASFGDNDLGKKIKKKKARHTNDNEESSFAEKLAVELEDISQEVDERLKKREEKRKLKLDKKRKKGIEISPEIMVPDVTTTAEQPGRPKKKRKSRENHDALVEATDTNKRDRVDNDQGQSESKKKRRKKHKESIES